MKKNGKSYSKTPTIGLPVVWSDSVMGGIACTDGKKVYVSDLFFEMPSFMKEFILLHEEGHVVNRHLERRFYAFFAEIVLQEMEKEADQYAIEHIGRLKSFITLCYLTGVCTNKEQMAERTISVFS